MSKQSLSLLREKFTIHTPSENGEADHRAHYAPGNRFELPLYDAHGDLSEHYIIRAQNMHCTVRMAARILQDYERKGPLQKRATPVNWTKIWQGAAGQYELTHNGDGWVAVYNHGKVIFSKGTHHPLLDLIERYAYQSHETPYWDCARLAENAFKETGTTVEIDHDANVALNVDLSPAHSIFGIIQRTPLKTMTLRISVKPLVGAADDKIATPQCLSAVAAYFEAIQICFYLGMTAQKIRNNIIEQDSSIRTKMSDARHRLARLRSEISNLENSYNVHYRPEKPDFDELIEEAEAIP